MSAGRQSSQEQWTQANAQSKWKGINVLWEMETLIKDRKRTMLRNSRARAKREEEVLLLAEELKT